MAPAEKSIDKPIIPDDMLACWQKRADLLAKIIDVPTCLIRQLGPTDIVVCVASNSDGNPYQRHDHDQNESSSYCGQLLAQRTPLLINNANNNPRWKNSPELRRGLISYSGRVLQWPNGKAFGTLCVLDNKEREYSETQLALLIEFKSSIEHDLETLFTALTAENDDPKLWRAIQSAALESILVMDTKGTFLSANDIGARRFGMTPAELVGKNLYDIVPADVGKLRQQNIDKAIKAKRSMRFEDSREGRYFDFTVYPVLDDQNEVDKVVVFAADITERRLTRQALEKSERKYRELVEEASTIILRWDIQGNVTFFNEYAQRFFGFTEIEILGKNVVGTIVPETEFTGRDLAKLMEQIRHDPDKFRDNENENIKRNGERVWIAWKNRPIFNDRGELCEIHSVGIDITARKRAEDALRESEALLRSLTESSSDHILTLDKELNIQFVNFASPGMTKEQLIGTPIYRYAAEDRQLEIKQLLEQVFKTGEQCSYETEYTDPDGNTIYYETVAAPKIVEDNVAGLTLNCRDVTERKQVQQALRDSEERLRLLISEADFILWSVDKELKFTSSLGGGLYALGLEPNQMVDVGLDLYQFFHDDSPESLPLKAHLEALQGESVTYENEWMGRYFHTQVSPHRDAQGNIIGCIGVAIDITDRKKIEEEVEKYRNHLEEIVATRTAELETSNKELESYSYSIAHDLRAPLRAITGFSQILKDDAGEKLNFDDIKILERIIAAGKNMSELIDDILELSRITRSKLHFGKVNLTGLGNDIIARLKQLHPERETQWQVQDDLIVQGDARLLEVAIQNLVENAWKYTRKEKIAKIQLGKTAIDGELVYYVKDNGVGFDMQYANKLFKPFHRLHSPTEFEGTGIGLATVQRIIQRHGGRIWADTRENCGATFYFTLRQGNLH